MYLRGSHWSMRRRRRKLVGSWYYVIVLSLAIAVMAYVNRYVVPTIPPPFLPTSTSTRAPETYVTEAQTLFDQGKLLQAIEKYQQAIVASPDDPALYVALARVQVFAGHYDEALTNASNALLLNPRNAMAFAVRGWALTRKKEYLQAESALKDALAIDDHNGLIHAYYAELLGAMYEQGLGALDTLDRAIEESRFATSLAPNTLEAHWARGYILEITDNREEAVREYEAAIAINPNIPEVHLALGRTYGALEVLDKAEREYTLANTLNPAAPLPDLYLSRLYARLGEFAKAAQYAEEAVKNVPTDAYLRANWAWTLYKNNLWPQALEQFSLAINGGKTEDGQVISPLTIDPNDIRLVQYFYTYAYMLAKSNRCGEAVPLAQRILVEAPNDEYAQYNAQAALDICEELARTPAAPVSATPSATPAP